MRVGFVVSCSDCLSRRDDSTKSTSIVLADYSGTFGETAEAKDGHGCNHSSFCGPVTKRIWGVEK